MALESVSLKDLYKSVNDAWPGEWDESQAASIALSTYYREHLVIIGYRFTDYSILCQWVESPLEIPDHRFSGMDIPELCQKMKQFIDTREMPPYKVLI